MNGTTKVRTLLSEFEKSRAVLARIEVFPAYFS